MTNTAKIHGTKSEGASKISVRSMTACAMLSAVAFVLQLIEFYIPIMPAFVKLDISDIPALVGAFVLGPIWGGVIELIKNLIHLPFGSSLGVGELCNFIFGAVFTVSAGYIYRFKKTRLTAVYACIAGSVLMAAVSLPLNYFFVYPAYVKIYGMPLESIISMYEEILPSVSGVPTGNTLLNCLLVFNLPFTLAKGILESFICHLIYKPISSIYKKGIG